VAKQGTHTSWTCDLQVDASRVTFTVCGVRDYDDSPSERAADEPITALHTPCYAMQLPALAATGRGTLLGSNADQ
jgi:hypothetical protein